MGLWNLAEHFAEQAELCKSDAELHQLLEDAARELGFRYFALVHNVSLRRASPRLITIDNYPAVWTERFIGEKLFVDDPVLHASQRTAFGFPWSEVPSLFAMRTRHRLIFEQGAREGLGDGYTVPANVPGEPNGSCSFATRNGLTLPFRHLACAHVIGGLAFRTARRLHGYPAPVDGVPHLSPRELDCLRLLASGKSDSVTAQLLGLSFDTVRFYVKLARSRYDTASRTQLVVHALRDGQISFDDAIPPNG